MSELLKLNTLGDTFKSHGRELQILGPWWRVVNSLMFVLRSGVWSAISRILGSQTS